MLEPLPELSSDLEWMLQSGQANSEMLAEALIEKYAALVSRLALAYFEDPDLAQQAVPEVFTAALLNTYRYRNQLGIQTWFFSVLAQVFTGRTRRARRREWLKQAIDTTSHLFQKKNGKGPDLEDGAGQAGEAPQQPLLSYRAESTLSACIQSLGDQERLAILLRGLLEWPVEEISEALHQKEASLQLHLYESGEKLSSALAVEAGPEALEQAREHWLARLLQERFPTPTLSDQELQHLCTVSVGEVNRTGVTRRAAARVKELALITSGVLMVTALIWGASLFLPALEKQDVTPTPETAVGEPAQQSLYYSVQAGDTLESIAGDLGTSPDMLIALNDLTTTAVISPGDQLRVTVELAPVQLAQPTPVTPVPKPEPLSLSSSQQAVRARMMESHALWNTLWMDVQSVDAGPENYRGPLKSYRTQVWISQPNLSLELYGLPGASPLAEQMVVGNRHYFSYLPLDQTFVEPVWGEARAGRLGNATLQDMVVPAEARFMLEVGDFQPVEEARVAGRDALVVDWLDYDGIRRDRLWVDAQTGLLLRRQQFGLSDPLLLTEDTLVTHIILDDNFSSPGLFDPQAGWKGGFASGPDGLEENQPQPLAPELSQSAARSGSFPPEPPPAEFEASGSRLSFQFSPDLDVYGVEAVDSRAPAQIFADGYYLGSLPLPLPWSIRCDRSPDGKRLAYTTWTDGTHLPGASLRWFNLVDLTKVYEPLPEFSVKDFAFASDSRRLAVFAGGARSEPTGVYMIDIATGERRLLLEISDARSLTWSPDGQSLALIGEDGEDEVMLVIRVESGVVTYRQENPLFPGPDWPTQSWGVDFPRSASAGLEACSLP